MSGIQQMLQVGGSVTPLNGLTWQEQVGWYNAGATLAYPNLYGGGNYFFSVDGPAQSSFFYSPDLGVTWLSANNYLTVCTANMLTPVSGPSYTFVGSTFLHGINQSTTLGVTARDAVSFLTSTDNGLTWTWRGNLSASWGTPATVNSAVKSGSTILLAGGSARTGAGINITAASMPDGATWTAPTDISTTVRGWVDATGFTATPRYVYSLGVGSSGSFIFCVVTSVGSVLYFTSSNLSTATRRTGLEAQMPGACKFVTGNGCTFAYGYGPSSTFTTAVSYDDGATWTTSTAISAQAAALGRTINIGNTSFVWDGTAFVGAVYLTDSSTYWAVLDSRSSNGLDWLFGSLSSSHALSPSNLVTNGNGISVFSTNTLNPSPDHSRMFRTPTRTAGTDWTPMPSNSTLAGVKQANDVWLVRNYPSASRYVLWATSNFTNVNVATTDNGASFSTAGNSSFRSVFGTANTVNDMCSGSGTTAMAIGHNTTPNNIFAHTTDGTTWVNTGQASMQTAMGVNAVGGVAFGGGLWVIVGAAGASATSPDRTTWTARTSLSSQYTGTDLFNWIIYTGSSFVATGSNGICATSTDGLTWTKRTTLASLVAAGSYSPQPFFVATSGGTLVFASWLTSTFVPVTAVSTDAGATWALCTQLNSLINSSTMQVSTFFGTGRATFIYADSLTPTVGNVMTSVDGQVWTRDQTLLNQLSLSATQFPSQGFAFTATGGISRALALYSSTTSTSPSVVSP